MSKLKDALRGIWSGLTEAGVSEEKGVREAEEKLFLSFALVFPLLTVVWCWRRASRSQRRTHVELQSERTLEQEVDWN